MKKIEINLVKVKPVEWNSHAKEINTAIYGKRDDPHRIQQETKKVKG